MSDLNFDQDNEFTGRVARRGASTGGFDLTSLVVRVGLAKDRQRAQYVLVGIIVVCVLVSYLVWHRHDASTAANALPTPDELVQQQS